jgi:hypothetical protein
MVVVIDDRSDIWKWSSNLVQVRPCNAPLMPDNFFMNGDINDPALIAGGKVAPCPIKSQTVETSTKYIVNTDDEELLRVKLILLRIHQEFFHRYDSQLEGESTPKVGENGVDVKVKQN